MNWDQMVEIFLVEDDEGGKQGYIVIWLESRKKLSHAGAFTSYGAAQRYVRSNFDAIHAEWSELFEKDILLGHNDGT